MDKDGDGRVDCGEFVDFMNDDLPRFRKHFDALIAEFIRIAALALAERQAAAAAAAAATMTAEQLRRVEALFLGLDRDHSGQLEVGEIVIVRNDDKEEMMNYLDRDNNKQISMTEWVEWHNYVFSHLPSRYANYDEFLLLLERLLREWLLAEEARKAAEFPVSPTRQEWQRSRRQARTPRSPRTPRKTASKSLMNYKGHSDWILAVAVLNIDSREILVTASQDTTARVYDVATGDSICTCGLHQGSVLAIAWSPSNPQVVLTGSLDGSVIQWQLFTGELVTHVEECHKKGVLAVEVAPDGQTFFTGSRDNTAVHWGLDGKQLQRYTGHSKWIQCLAQGADGTLLYTGSADEKVKEWDIATGNCLHTLEGHTQEITSMFVSGNFLYTGSREATAKRWDLTSKEEVHQFTGHLSVVRDVAIWNGYLFTGSADGTAKCWDVVTGECKFTVTGHEFAVTSISLTDGFIFTGSSDATVRKFAFETPL
jgi:Ca2+-binding EF-hand superfamily protein